MCKRLITRRTFLSTSCFGFLKQILLQRNPTQSDRVVLPSDGFADPSCFFFSFFIYVADIRQQLKTLNNNTK